MSDADQKVVATRTDGGLCIRREGSSTAWVHSSVAVDAQAVR
jgi:hypothetical protein